VRLSIKKEEEKEEKSSNSRWEPWWNLSLTLALAELFEQFKTCTVKRPSHILLTKVQMWPGPGLNLHRHFQQSHVADKIHQIQDGCAVASHM